MCGEPGTGDFGILTCDAVRAPRAGLLGSRGVRRAGQPQVQVRLDGPRIGRDPRPPSPAVSVLDGLARPRVPHPGQAVQRVGAAGGAVLRGQHEVVRVPAGGRGQAGTSAGEVVDERPVLHDGRRVMERGDDTARPQPHPFGLCREGGRGQRRIGVGAPEGAEVPLGQPNRGETVPVGEARAVEEQVVLDGSVVRFPVRAVRQTGIHDRLPAFSVRAVQGAGRRIRGTDGVQAVVRERPHRVDIPVPGAGRDRRSR
ncbi:hypothetical protein SUDANB176_06677 [Streptomyces sp. enrichment culture]